MSQENMLTAIFYGKSAIFRVADFGLFSHTDIIDSAEALLQHPQKSRPSDPIQQRLNMDFLEVRSLPKPVEPDRQEST